MADLVEIDSLEAIVVDNELDILSSLRPSDKVKVGGHLADIAMRSRDDLHERGNAAELRMEDVCCGAFWLPVLLV